MNATTKLAQAAKGSRVCQGCGRTKVLSKFPVHGRWKTPLKICDECMTARRKAGAAKRKVKVLAVKQAEARQEQAVNEAIPILWARLEGYAMALKDKALTDLIHELKGAMTR